MIPQKFIQRGQAMLLYALLVPILICFVGVGLDLGWYYLNVSRLQNAADAAAVAGAYKLIDTNDKLSDYKGVWLVERPNIDDDPDDDIDTTSGYDVAADYAHKNLSSSNVEWTGNNGNYIMTDSWGIGGNSKINMGSSLYKIGENYYLFVTLSEKVDHFFLSSEIFGLIEAPVVAVAILTKNAVDDTDDTGNTGTTTPSPLELIFNANEGSFGDVEETSIKLAAIKSNAMKSAATTSTKTLNSLEEITENNETVTVTADDGTPTRDGYEFLGWNTKADGSGTYIYDGKQLLASEVAKLFGGEKSVTLYAVWKSVSKPVEDEVKDPINNITLWQQMEYVRAKNAYDGDWSVSAKKYGAAMNYIQFNATNAKSIEIKTTTKNNNNVKDIDRLFLDFLPESTDYSELRNPSKRPHALINVNAAYDVRDGKNDDPLYIRIESEPAHNASGGNQGNPPQQIIININVSNLADSKRPLIFYYDGPLEDRDPVPVILNLNTDFKGVLYMPDVPVVINGNGKGVGEGNGTNHVFEGFIIAKEFRVLDKTSASYKAAYTVNSNRTTYKVDSKNNVQTILVDGDYQKLSGKLDEFYLSSESQFRKFKIETDLDFMYIHYDENGDMVPLTDRDGNELIPLYDKSGTRITDWDKVKLYDKEATDSSRKEYPKKDTDHARVPLLDSDGKPVPLYDEYGNKIYFCEDYGRLGIQYTILTLHRVDDETRKPHEFLLTQPESNSDDWL